MLKALDLWLPAWLRRPRPTQTGPGMRHVMLCVCDHFEPFHGVGKTEAMDRVSHWALEWPRLIKDVSPNRLRQPRHTFFYPIEQYDADVVQALAELCEATGSEVEVHLHHEDDTAAHMAGTLREGAMRFAGHGLLSRDEGGELRYGFVHGNWALDNSHPQGRHCGVQNELRVLSGTGCYADFTLPSAPNRTQTRTINSMYYARGTDTPKSHDVGDRVRAGAGPRQRSADELLMVQGPLALNWKRRKFGVLPRIENSDLTGLNPPSVDRMRVWMECEITVEGRPEWLFVKLHTHGATPANSRMLLGEPMRAFHRGLQRLEAQEAVTFHHVTARELVNIVHAAEAGHSGDPTLFRDFRYTRPGARTADVGHLAGSAAVG